MFSRRFPAQSATNTVPEGCEVEAGSNELAAGEDRGLSDQHPVGKRAGNHARDCGSKSNRWAFQCEKIKRKDEVQKLYGLF